MPLQQTYHFSDQLQVAIWKCQERESELLDLLPANWQARLPSNEIRRLETLSARCALLALEPSLDRFVFSRNTDGKPFLCPIDTETQLAEASDWSFSLSHSHHKGAAALSPHPCGVDLQLRVDKIVRLRSKFERPEEHAFIRAQADEVGALHVLWGAKESLFKIWSRREIHWTNHLFVEPFTYSSEGGSFHGSVRKGGRRLDCIFYYSWYGEFCLVAGHLENEYSV